MMASLKLINLSKVKKILRVFLERIELILFKRENNIIKEKIYFVFLITPPRSGSTLISRILRTSKAIESINDRAEAQWLLNSTSAPERWDEDHKTDLKLLSNLMINRCRKIFHKNKDFKIIFDKSPAHNLLRIKKFRNFFPNHICIVSNRNPYAYIGSSLSKNRNFHFTKQFLSEIPTYMNLEKSSKREIKIFLLTMHWISCSKKLINHIREMKLEFLTYEKFTENPSLLFACFPDKIKDFISDMDYEAKVKVKNYPLQGISNQNSRQISVLTSTDLKVINKVLKMNLEIMNFFDYQLITNQ